MAGNNTKTRRRQEVTGQEFQDFLTPGSLASRDVRVEKAFREEQRRQKEFEAGRMRKA